MINAPTIMKRKCSTVAASTSTAKARGIVVIRIGRMVMKAAPTNEPMIRTDYPDVIYKSEREKFRAVIKAGGRLCAIEADGSVAYDTFLSPPLFPDLEYPAGRPALALTNRRQPAQRRQPPGSARQDRLEQRRRRNDLIAVGRRGRA